MNNEEHIYFGIDLSISRPSARATLNRHLICDFDEWQYNDKALGIIPEEQFSHRSICAIDGPQGLALQPKATMRKGERLLGTAGKSPYDLPKEDKPYSRFVRYSVRLFYSINLSSSFYIYGTLETKDFCHIVIEVYPGSAWRVFNRAIWPPKKRTWSGREERFKLLKGLGLTFPQFLSSELPTHDQLDAAVSAYIGYLFVNDKTEKYGESPVVDEKIGVLREGFIIQPERTAYYAETT